MEGSPVEIALPLSEEKIRPLKAGMKVLLFGEMLAARDTVHQRFAGLLKRGEKLPVCLDDQTIYYMGPSPAKPGAVIGAAGPTTSGRMDSFTVMLLSQGLRGMVGKGSRTQEVKDAIVKYRAIYLGAMGGIGALLSKKIIDVKTLAFEDLGAEALRMITVREFPAVVINDMYGGDLYLEGIRKYERS
jgi:fumarate hydratase subunit beta